jgi:long-chain acyl-CoA synthetase
VQEALPAAAGTLADRIRVAAADRPDRPALVAGDRTVSWSEFDALVDAAARGIGHAIGEAARPVGGTTGVSAAGRAAGRGHPPRVAIALGNTVEFVVCYFATLRAGLVAVPLNPEFTAPELRHILTDSGAQMLIGTDRVRDLATGLRPELPALTGIYPAAPAAPSGDPAGPVVPGGPGLEELAVLLYTSGTVGRPKGAMLSHRALLANNWQAARIEPPTVGSSDVVLLALPLFHAYGLNSALGAVAYHGACGVLLDRFDPATGADLVARERVSVLLGVPSMFLDWPAAPPPASLRVAICGAAPLEPAVAAAFTAATGVAVHVGYGLTETAPMLASTLTTGRAVPGSIGRPLPGVELRLVGTAGEGLWYDDGAATAYPGSALDGGGEGGGDDEGPDLDLASSGTDPGQIVVRGANLFSGYWPDGHGGPDADGWWPTGDVAYADADSNLHLVDRLGELILVNGFNVYPREVELVLQTHPGVAESAVLGVPHPRTGETVEAYVVPAQGAAPSAEELLAHCGQALARFKRPTRIRLVAALPRSVNGKVRKSQLRSECGNE